MGLSPASGAPADFRRRRILLVVGTLVVGTLVVGTLVVGTLVVGTLVVGTLVVGTLVVGTLVVGTLVVGTLVVGRVSRPPHSFGAARGSTPIANLETFGRPGGRVRDAAHNLGVGQRHRPQRVIR